MGGYFLTVFTPTYNRANLLYDLYKSLCKQTDKDFIWLVVDDGSTDETANVIGKWKKDHQINIEYVYQKNGGKHVAHNYGVELCHTDLFFCVDSDDSLREDAVEKIHSWWQCDCKDDFMGYVCPKKEKSDISNRKINSWPRENSLIDFYELERTYQYRRETALIFVTKELKKYKFPTFPDERFVTEIVLYYQFRKLMKVKNDLFYLYEYLENGYTKQGKLLSIKNPKGEALLLACKAMRERNLYQRLKWKIKYYAWVKCFMLNPNIANELVPFYNISFMRKENKIAWFGAYFRWLRKKKTIDEMKRLLHNKN